MTIYFSIAGERGLAKSLAEVLGVEFEKVELPEPESGLPVSLRSPTEEVSAYSVDHELRAHSKGPVQTIEDGLAQLNAGIEARDESSIPDIARDLGRRAQRAEALALPPAGRYANPVLSRIEAALSRKG